MSDENSPMLAVHVEAKKWGYELSATEAAHIAEAALEASVQAPERTLEVGYTPAELVSAVEETRRYLTVEHPGRGCIGCDKCTRISLLDITAAGIEELVAVQAPAVDREALEAKIARGIKHWSIGVIGATVIDRAELIRGLAGRIIASGILQDASVLAREVEARGLEKAADIADSIGHVNNNQHSHIAWEAAEAIRARAQQVREGNASSPEVPISDNEGEQ